MKEASSDALAGRTHPDAPAARSPAPVRHLSDRLLGTLGTLLILGGVGFAVAQLAAAGDPAPAVAPAAPALEIVDPVSGAASGTAVEIVFTSAERLSRGPMGWQVGDLHLHAGVDGRDVMPGAGDITRLGEGRYRWTLRLPAEREVEIRLFWSGPDHRPLEEGASLPVRVLVR